MISRSVMGARQMEVVERVTGARSMAEMERVMVDEVMVERVGAD
jgi:hypothetical protein